MRAWSKVGLMSAAVAVAAIASLAGCDRDGAVPATPPPPPPVTTPGGPVPPRPATTRAARVVEPEAPAWESYVMKGAVQPDATRARVLQVIEAFDHPESVTLSWEGTHLFVTNASLLQGGARYKRGAISKLAIGPDGRLKMLEPRFVTGLHSPMGITVLPRATKRFPVGTLVVCTGATNGIDEQGEPITDVTKFDPGVTLIDPASGKTLGHIPMGAETPVAKSVYHAIITPNAVTFDREGNLFVADTSNTGKVLEPPILGRPGVIRIRHAHLDAAVGGGDPGNVSYLPVRHEPAGLYYSPVDDGVYWTTSDGKGPAGGAVYRCPRIEFPAENMVSNVIGDVGPLEGLFITPNNTLIMSRSEGDLYYINSRRLDSVRYEDPFTFAAPGDVRLHTLPNGHNIVYVPEIDPSSTEEGKQRLWVLLLPSSL